MAHWLLKTEPGQYSWTDLVREKRAVWNGITNALALKHLRCSAAGDTALIYHAGDEKRVVGIARIVKGPYPDPTREDPRFAVVELAPVKPLKVPVPLVLIKADPAFAGWDLLRLARLSFVPVPRPIWERLLEMSRTR